MSWFPHQAPVVSLDLVDQSPDAPPFVLDVFPHRWSVQRGFEDAVLSFLAGYASNDYRTDLGMWSKRESHALTDSGYACDDYAFGPGGFVGHKGTPVRGHTLTFRMEGTHLVLPDGTRLLVRTFAEPARNAYSPVSGSVNRNAVRSYLTNEAGSEVVDTQLRHNATSFFLGVAEAFVASPAATELRMSAHHGGEQFAAIAARTMRHLVFVPRSGKDAVEWIYNHTKATATAFFLAWGVRPNRGWSAERWVLGDVYPELCSLCPNPVQRAAGQAAGAVFFASQNDFSVLVGDSVTSTAHGKIAARFLRDRVEDAALLAYAADPTLLKPMAARRAAKLAAA
jgi:hypothetical protein